MKIFNLPDDELNFLNEDTNLRDYFYGILINIKNNDEPQVINIECKNSYERRIVHILAHSLGLYHSRLLCRFFRRDCCCIHSWKHFGSNNCYKFVGVKVANVPIYLSKKDRIHQKITTQKMSHFTP
jgi:hypothetical protein